MTDNEVSFVCLKPHERDFFVSRIICGYFDISLHSKTLKFKHPNKYVNFESNKIYTETYNNCINNDLMTDNEVMQILINEYDWNYDKEKLIRTHSSKLLDLKIELFNNLFNKNRQLVIRKDIKSLVDEYNNLMIVRNHFNHLTAAGISQNAKWNYVFGCCIYCDGKKYLDLNDTDINLIATQYWNNYLDDSKLRDIAKSEPWASLWYAAKGGNIFRNKYGDMNSEQIRLISWARMYDNIRKSHKPPTQDVIEDDDMLDGWMAFNRRIAEKETEVSTVERKIGNKKILNSQNVFVPVTTFEDAERINNLNTSQGKAMKKKEQEKE